MGVRRGAYMVFVGRPRCTQEDIKIDLSISGMGGMD
jgi:hypothetical protein